MANSQYTIADAVKLAAPSFGQTEKAKDIIKLGQQYETAGRQPVSIVVCGEFKRGKSTFINAFIGRNLCATDTDICTAVVSVIRYAPEETAVRYYGDFSNPKQQKISLEEIEKYTVGGPEDTDNTIYVEIGLPLPILKEGYVIIDTPGVGGLDARHAALTNFFIPKADIALFITDVNEPLTSTETEYYKTKVRPYAPKTAFIVNKADLREPSEVEEIRLDTIAKIATAVEVGEEEIEALAVSAAAEAYPDSGLGESNYGELREMVKRLASQHRIAHKAALKASFTELINLAIAPLEAQLRQIEQPDVNQIGELNRQKESIDKKLLELKDPNSQFRVEISREMTRRREEILNYINESNVTLQSETFTRILQSPEARREGGGRWMGQQLNDAIAQIGSEVKLQLDEIFRSIAEMPQFEGLLQFEARDYVSNIVVRDVDTHVPFNKRVTPLMSGVSIATLGSVYLATFGVGAVLTAIGVGAYVALGNSSDSSRNVKESALRQVYQPQLSGAISSINTYVNTRFTEFQQEWLAVLTRRCKAYQESIQEAINNINAVKQAVNQAVNIRAQVQKKLKPLVMARNIVAQLA